MIDLKTALANPENISKKLKTRGYSLNLKFKSYHKYRDHDDKISI